MSRSGYHDDHDDDWALIRWRGQVASATRGKRGQRMFRELKAALEAMPVKRLIAGELICEQDVPDPAASPGDVCALGALGVARGVEMASIDPEDTKQVGAAFDIAHQLAAEVEYMNDECGRRNETRYERWQRMYNWVCSQIVEHGGDAP